MKKTNGTRMVIPTITVTLAGTVTDATDEEYAAIIKLAEDACPDSNALREPDVEPQIASLEESSSA